MNMSNVNQLNENSLSETVSVSAEAPVKRGRGRPKGSKNKPKFNPDGTPLVKSKMAKSATVSSALPSEVSYEDL